MKNCFLSRKSWTPLCQLLPFVTPPPPTCPPSSNPAIGFPLVQLSHNPNPITCPPIASPPHPAHTHLPDASLSASWLLLKHTARQSFESNSPGVSHLFFNYPVTCLYRFPLNLWYAFFERSSCCYRLYWHLWVLKRRGTKAVSSDFSLFLYVWWYASITIEICVSDAIYSSVLVLFNSGLVLLCFLKSFYLLITFFV